MSWLVRSFYSILSTPSSYSDYTPRIGQAPKDHATLRSLSALIASLPASENKGFREEFDTVRSYNTHILYLFSLVIFAMTPGIRGRTINGLPLNIDQVRQRPQRRKHPLHNPNLNLREI